MTQHLDFQHLNVPRRNVLIGMGALGLLVSCGPAGPGSATFTAQAAAGMNPGPDGADRPLTVTILQLRGSGAFDGADFFALQNPSAALGADLIKADTIALAPGGSASKTIVFDPGTSAIGVVAGFRDPAGKQFRAKSAVSPTDTVAFRIEVGATGLVLVPA